MRLDEIGYWSEVKLDIVKNYAVAYSRILAAQKSPSLHHTYIDAFAGSGMHISKSTGEFVPGSPLNALLIDPPFKEYHLIDWDNKKVDSEVALTNEAPIQHVGFCEKSFPILDHGTWTCWMNAAVYISV